MEIIEYINDNSDINIIFLHGWGVNHTSLSPLAKHFISKYNVYLMDLTGFDKTSLTRAYTIEDYIGEIEHFIANNHLENIVIFGHSFGGKIACKLKLLHPNYKVIALAPSIVKVQHQIKIKIKICLYKVLKFLHFKIPTFLQGSNDYKNTYGLLRETFKNVCHVYLSKDEIKQLSETLIFIFSEDKQINNDAIKKLQKRNEHIHIIKCDGNHFGYLNNIIEIVRLSSIYIHGDKNEIC